MSKCKHGLSEGSCYTCKTGKRVVPEGPGSGNVCSVFDTNTFGPWDYDSSFVSPPYRMRQTIVSNRGRLNAKREQPQMWKSKKRKFKHVWIQAAYKYRALKIQYEFEKEHG
jgi:hypothetical protein